LFRLKDNNSISLFCCCFFRYNPDKPFNQV